MASAARPSSGTFEQRRAVQRIDVFLVLATLLLLACGLMSLYSVSQAASGSDLASRTLASAFRKQLINIGVGLVPFGVFALVHPKFWLKNASLLYAINLGLLAMVLVAGKETMGAARWIDLGPLQFQPSELAKLLTVLTLASFFATRQDSLHKGSTFALSFLHVAIPMFLVFRQPHLGATGVLLMAWLAVSVMANVPSRYLLATGATAVLCAGLVFTVPSLRNKVLDDYQVRRIQGMRGSDSRGKTYQTDRAQIAFGVGGVLGTGFLRGEQKQARFIPLQHNDFIFTVVGEEGGLIGCTLVLLCFGFFFYRVWLIMFAATEPFYRMVCGGIFAVLGFHTIVNLAMVLQLVPVVGLWLPFLSHGGTAIWLCMASVGLLLNIRRREKPLLF